MQISNFAVIKNEEVQNIIVGNYTDVSHAAKQIYGNDAIAVEVYSLYYPPAIQIPVMVGDIYQGNKFYRGTEEILPITLPVDRIQSLENTATEQSATIDDLIIAITPTEAQV